MSFNTDSSSFNVPLVNGSIIINGDHISTTSNIMYCVKEAIGTQGLLTLSNQLNGTVTILSSDINDQSIINDMIW